MAAKINKKWADSIADGSHELFADLNKAKAAKTPAFLGLSDLYREGQRTVEVLVKIGICRSSYHKACAVSKKFKMAHEEGLRRSEAWWLTLGRAGAAKMKDIQPATWIFTMKNLFGYSDKRELTTKTGADDLDNATITPEMTPEDAAKLYQAEILRKV